MPVVETGTKPGTAYPAIWTRDHAYVVWHDPAFTSSTNVRQFVTHRLTKRSTGTDFSPAGYGTTVPNFIADRIESDGTVKFQNPGASALPFMDGIAFVVLALWSDFKATGSTTTFTTNKAAIDACLAAIPRSANGCVYSNPSTPSIDYGFTDTILKTGDVAYGTALQAWAYKMCAEMNGEVGSGQYTTLRAAAVAGLATLRKSSGWFSGSSANNAARDDVWATALIVAEGLIDNHRDLVASATVLRDAYLAGTITSRGWVKHLPTGQTWAGTSTTIGTYQNGGYWLTPVWDCLRAVAVIDAVTARTWAREAMIECAAQRTAQNGSFVALFEWFGAPSGGNNYASIGSAAYTPSNALVKRFITYPWT